MDKVPGIFVQRRAEHEEEDVLGLRDAPLPGAAEPGEPLPEVMGERVFDE